MTAPDNLGTKRLTIRRFTPDDGMDLLEYAIYKESTGFDTWEAWPTDEAGCRGVAGFFANSDRYWAVCRKSDSKVIGLIAYNGMDDDGNLDLGHGFVPTHNRDGESTEAIRAMVDCAFDTFDITAIDARNPKDWTEQVAPLHELGFVDLDDRMRMTRDKWKGQR